LAVIAVSTIGCQSEQISVAVTRDVTDQEADALISWSAGEEIFPPSWLRAPFYQKARPIDAAQKARARAIVMRELGKYPKSVVSKTIRRIYILGEMLVYRSLRFAGTASHECVYIVVRDRSLGYTDDFVESVFHQEYSTLLLNRHLMYFDQKSWKAVNPEGFAYLGPNSWDRVRGKDGGARAMTKAKGSVLLSSDPARVRQGFLSRYAMSSIENDFNAYAAALFRNDTGFWKHVEKHAAVKKKAELAIEFYHKIDPTFTREYFRKLPPTKPKQKLK